MNAILSLTDGGCNGFVRIHCEEQVISFITIANKDSSGRGWRNWYQKDKKLCLSLSLSLSLHNMRDFITNVPIIIKVGDMRKSKELRAMYRQSCEGLMSEDDEN